MQLTVKLFTYVFFINFAAFFVKGLAGFGDPLISSPLLAFFFDSKMISPTNLCFGTPINGYMVWKNRHNFSVKQALPMLLSILCGVIPGTILLRYASSWIIKAGLGVLLLGIGAEMLTRNRSRQINHNNFAMVAACFLSGVSSGLYGINLFFVAYLERTTKGRNAFRANICFIFFIENVFRVFAYIISGVFNKYILLLVFISLPGVLLGFIVGSKVNTKLNDVTIWKIIIFVFMLGGLSVLINALALR